jgi:hypothetical protein
VGVNSGSKAKKAKLEKWVHYSSFPTLILNVAFFFRPKAPEIRTPLTVPLPSSSYPIPQSIHPPFLSANIPQYMYPPSNYTSGQSGSTWISPVHYYPNPHAWFVYCISFTRYVFPQINFPILVQMGDPIQIFWEKLLQLFAKLMALPIILWLKSKINEPDCHPHFSPISHPISLKLGAFESGDMGLSGCIPRPR